MPPYEQFAHSDHGRDIYTLHYHLDISVVDEQSELVPIQKRILVEATRHWREQEREEAENDVDTPSSSASSPSTTTTTTNSFNSHY